MTYMGTTALGSLQITTRPVDRRSEVPAARVETKAAVPATEVNAVVVVQAAVEKAAKSRRVEIDNVYRLEGKEVKKPTPQQRQNISSAYIEYHGSRGVRQNVTLASGAAR